MTADKLREARLEQWQSIVGGIANMIQDNDRLSAINAQLLEACKMAMNGQLACRLSNGINGIEYHEVDGELWHTKAECWRCVMRAAIAAAEKGSEE